MAVEDERDVVVFLDPWNIEINGMAKQAVVFVPCLPEKKGPNRVFVVNAVEQLDDL